MSRENPFRVRFFELAKRVEPEDYLYADDRPHELLVRVRLVVFVTLAGATAGLAALGFLAGLVGFRVATPGDVMILQTTKQAVPDPAAWADARIRTRLRVDAKVTALLEAAVNNPQPSTEDDDFVSAFTGRILPLNIPDRADSIVRLAQRLDLYEPEQRTVILDHLLHVAELWKKPEVLDLTRLIGELDPTVREVFFSNSRAAFYNTMKLIAGRETKITTNEGLQKSLNASNQQLSVITLSDVPVTALFDGLPTSASRGLQR